MPDPLAMTFQQDLDACTECGCTEFEPCVNDEGGTCSWVSEGLCSFCAPLLAFGDAGSERDDEGFRLDEERGLWLR